MSLEDLTNPDAIEELAKIIPEGGVPELDQLLKSPRDWVPSPSFPLILIPPPERLNIWHGPVNGFEIRGRDVFLIEDGQRRKANRAEALRVRRNAYTAFGEDIARIAGIEPE